MAKADNANLFEKYVEKGLLAVVVLFLIYAVIHWGLGSPRAIEIDNDVVGPGESAEALAEFATEVQRASDQAPAPKRTEKQKPPVVPGPPLAGRRLTNLTAARRVAESSDFTPDPVSVSLAELAKITPGPTKPDVTIHAELPDIPNRKVPIDTFVARPMALFPIEQIRKAWDEKVDSKFAVKVLLLAVEVERKAGHPGAEWEKIPAETVKLPPSPMFAAGGRQQRNVELVEVPKIPPYDGKNVVLIGQMLNEIKELQEHLFQPDYWQILSDDQWVNWRLHLPQEPLKRFEADVQAKLGEGYEERVAARRGRRSRGGRAMPRRGIVPDRMPGDLRRPGGMGRGGFLDDEIGPPGGLPRGRTPGRRRGGRGARGAIVDVESAPIPSFAAQVLYGHVLVWAHDLSVRPGQWYRYRIRLKLHNPLHMNENYLARKNRPDAKKTEILTRWSPWSDPQQTPRATEFYLTGVSQSEAKITVFTRVYGKMQQHDFTVARGQSIGGIEEKTVSNPYAAGQAGQEQFRALRVNFGTGAMLVDMRSRTVPATTGMLSKSNEILYLDRGRRLQTAPVAARGLEPELYKRYKNLKDSSESGGR